jgi:hypothetical protein
VYIPADDLLDTKKKSGRLHCDINFLADVYINVIITKNSVALVRERTIPAERPPPVGEVSADFCG